MAADVVYDTGAIGVLADTVRRFLSDKRGRTAVFATSVRNRATFDTFEEALEKRGVGRRYESEDTLGRIPQVFPIYHLHPRNGIRVCTMTLTTDDDDDDDRGAATSWLVQ